MRRNINSILIVLFVILLTFGIGCEKKSDVDSEGDKQGGVLVITKDMKCHACGMRVYEFKNWHTQIVYKDGSNDGFCAVKCLMAYYFEPEKYQEKWSCDDFKTLYAKDYYTLEWHDMKKMVFVLGSDVLGPMGKDLVPFIDRKKAKTFLEDHNAGRILTFNEIKFELINKLRKKKDKGLM